MSELLSYDIEPDTRTQHQVHLTAVAVTATDEPADDQATEPVQQPHPYTGALVDDTVVRFRVADPDHRLRGVRLWQEVRIPGDALGFASTADGWELVLGRPPVHRMEYMFELQHPDGGTETVLDPTNTNVTRGVFGDHSTLEMPGYEAPAWLALEPVASTRARLEAPARGGLKSPVAIELWSPADAKADEALPLLIAHDGPEYDDLSSLSHYFGVQIAAGTIPRARLALLSPGDRNVRYSASPGYARTLVGSVIPTIDEAAPIAGRPVIMGASLGALAALHAETIARGTFAGLFLQSGSFFQPRHDGQERGFGRYWRIAETVTKMLEAKRARVAHRFTVSMTCGVIEENIHNNRLMAERLAAQGHDVRFTEVPDMHTYTAWRDAFDPYLTDLLVRCFAPSRPTRKR